MRARASRCFNRQDWKAQAILSRLPKLVAVDTSVLHIYRVALCKTKLVVYLAKNGPRTHPPTAASTPATDLTGVKKHGRACLSVVVAAALLLLLLSVGGGADAMGRWRPPSGARGEGRAAALAAGGPREIMMMMTNEDDDEDEDGVDEE